MGNSSWVIQPALRNLNMVLTMLIIMMFVWFFKCLLGSLCSYNKRYGFVVILKLAVPHRFICLNTWSAVGGDSL